MNPVQLLIQLNGSAAVADGLKRITDGVGSLGTRLLALAGVGSALGAIGAGLKDIIDEGGKLNDLSAQTGIAVQRLVVLQQAFEDNGVAAESLGQKVNFLQRSLVEAAEEGGQSAQALRKLGLSAEELLAMDPGDMFQRTAEALQRVPDPAQRAALAMELFGRGAGDLLPLLGDEGAFATAAQNLGQLPELLDRNARRLDAVGDSMGLLKAKVRGLFAGLVDEIGPEIQTLTDQINQMDLTEGGRNAGAFVAAFIAEWRKGNLDQIVALTIQAGFEQGVDEIERVFDWLTDQGPANLIGNLTVSVIAGVAKAFIEIDKLARAFSEALGQYLFTYALSALQRALNGFAGGMEKVFKVDLPRVRVTTADFDRAFEQALARGEVRAGTMTGVIDTLLQKYRETFGIQQGITDLFGNQVSAAERLAALIDAQKQASVEPYGPPTPPTPRPPPTPGGLSRGSLQEDLDFRAKLLDVSQRRALVESDWRRTQQQKWPEIRRLLAEEASLMDERIARLRTAQDLERDPKEKDAIGKRLAEASEQRARVTVDVERQGADPKSIADQMQVTMVQIQESIGTVAQSIARTFSSVVQSAIDGVAGSIRGLITATMSWGEALRNIGSSILNGVINAISKMFAEWIVGRLAAKAVEIAASAAEGTAKAVPALMESIKSYGVAVALGMAAMAGILAATGAFAAGGETPNKPTLAWVGEEGTELILPAPVTSRLSTYQRSALVSGNFAAVAPPSGSRGAAGSSPGTSPTPDRPQRILILSDERRLQDLESDPAFENVVVRVNERNRWRFAS